MYTSLNIRNIQMINMHKICDTIKNINESSLTFGTFSIPLGFVATGKTITKLLVVKNSQIQDIYTQVIINYYSIHN